MLNIILIGAGNIGSRHLQSFAFLEENAHILLVDPRRENRLLALERLESVEGGNKGLELKVEERDRLPESGSFDLAVVATGSNVRAEICRELLAGCRIRYLVLEKFLFQARDEYDAVAELLRETGTSAWVNHWITDTYGYNRAAQQAIRGRPFEMTVSGSGWGLCCNAVHHLEFFDHLCGRREIQLSDVIFEQGAIPSKRTGYFEINGNICFECPDSGGKLRLECRGDNVNFAEIVTEIQAGEDRVRMVLHFGRLACEFQVDGNTWSEDLVLHPQSKRSHLWVHDLMERGRCGLPTYDRSCYQHLLVFPEFLKHFLQAGVTTGERCPVT